MPAESPYPLPTFIVVGANKGGTTSLFHYLQQHPEVYLSPLKEPHYFSKDIDPEQFSKGFAHNKLRDIAAYVSGPMTDHKHAGFVRSWDHYCKLFKFANGAKAIGELSTSYLYSSAAAREIREALGDIRIIICLRNPINRAYSHYRMNLWTGNSKAKTFMQALREDQTHEPKVWGNAHLYVEIGLYYEQVKRYYEQFSPDHIKIIFSQELRKHPEKVVRDLYEFIGVNPDFQPDTTGRFNEVYTPKFKGLTWFLNKTGIRPMIKRLSGQRMKQAVVKTMFRNKEDKGSMTDEERNYLADIYREDVDQLSKLIGCDLNHWIPKQEGTS
ncbi:MAG: sulfotransferase domain-containing protein [Chitinophagales bacterium]|nr:sulfotransferase domain-containing protein [Chitinophagales bacterium]HAE34638.1 hypothetical protein [Bacteroidota bacterium]MCB9022418.1 sulfotransferase domain-containing protein [Chitinophagales bacterium]HPE97454.1 sulfotransferase domain-containing protein [Chitinophagales bacterium]HPR29571.1 sulfotransferase domain-containing protein [Chitinophagales bacterium]